MPASLLCDFDPGTPPATVPSTTVDRHQRALDLALERFNWLNLGGGAGGGGSSQNDSIFSTNHHHHPQQHPTLLSVLQQQHQAGDGDHQSTTTLKNLTAMAAAAAAAAAAANTGKRSQNTTECVPVPSSEHVAEIVGRQGCKIKALRAKTNTYIKTPVRGEEPVFVVTGRKEDVNAAKREILSAAEHFSQIRAQRKNNPGNMGPAPNAHLPGHVTIQVRVPYRVVGLVVGPKGATIKRIQQQTNTYIITPSRDKDPVFEVTGLPEDVETARKEIEAHIAIRTGGIIDSTGTVSNQNVSRSIGTPDETTSSGSDFSNSPQLSFDNLFLSGLAAAAAAAAKNHDYGSSTKPGHLDSFGSSKNSSQTYKDLCSIFSPSKTGVSKIVTTNNATATTTSTSSSYDTDEGIGDSPTFDILSSGNFNSMWTQQPSDQPPRRLSATESVYLCNNNNIIPFGGTTDEYNGGSRRSSSLDSNSSSSAPNSSII